MSDTAYLLTLMADSFMMPQRNKDLLKEAARELDAIAAPIRVKPLVWVVTDDAKLGISFTNFGQYVIDMGSTEGKFCALFNEASVVVIKDQWWFGTIDEAKAAAQADYERRIRDTLEDPKAVQDE